MCFRIFHTCFHLIARTKSTVCTGPAQEVHYSLNALKAESLSQCLLSAAKDHQLSVLGWGRVIENKRRILMELRAPHNQVWGKQESNQQSKMPQNLQWIDSLHTQDTIQNPYCTWPYVILPPSCRHTTKLLSIYPRVSAHTTPSPQLTPPPP